MKKIILLSAMLLGGAMSGAYAQNFSLGIRGGVNFASFSTEAANDTDEAKIAAEEYKDDRRGLAGPMAGLIVNYAFNDNVSFQPELLFSAKGYKREGDFDHDGLPTPPIKYEDKTIMNYAEVPLLAKFSVGSEDVKISFLAGPYIGYLLGGRNTYKVGGQQQYKEKLNFEYTETNKTKFQRLDAGAVLGASLGYNVGIGTVMADIRYNYGLTDNYEYETLDEDAVKVYNRTFSVSFGWIYRFGESSLKPKPRSTNPEMNGDGQQ